MIAVTDKAKMLDSRLEHIIRYAADDKSLAAQAKISENPWRREDYLAFQRAQSSVIDARAGQQQRVAADVAAHFRDAWYGGKWPMRLYKHDI